MHVADDSRESQEKNPLSQLIIINNSDLTSGISLNVRPGPAISKDSVNTTMPPFSIALNGVVESGPFFDGNGPFQNFNHCKEVDPEATRTSSFQVWMAIKMGLADTFKKDGSPQMEISLRECDRDTALSVWLLKNHEKCVDARFSNQIERLVFAIDELRYAPEAGSLYTGPKLVKQIAAIFEPCNLPKLSNDGSSQDVQDVISTIDEVGERITRFVENSEPHLKLEVRSNSLSSNHVVSCTASEKIYKSNKKSHQAHQGLHDQEFTQKIAEGISLHVIPRAVYSWDEFKAQMPPFSIALDGFVFGRPYFAAKGPYKNCNHHEEVDRLATRSTCAQVFRLIKMGLFRTFAEEGAPRMNVYVNDCDEDVALSVWLLKNHELIENPKYKRKIERLVRAADLLDATAGAFPLDPNSKIMRMTAWIFEPFKVARAADRIHGMTGQDMALMLEEVGARITSFVSGSGEQRELDTRYVEHGKNNGWSLIKEIGSEGRNGFFHDGGKAFISFRQNSEQPGYAYTISRLSPYIDFPITEIYSVLNKAEGIEYGAPNSWGGSEIIGGSPRSTGSRLTPDEILNIINDYLSKRSGITS